MDKLIITVTCDGTMALPKNPNSPQPTEFKPIADEYIRSINAGASLVHTHGSYTMDTKIQPDGRQLQSPVIEGWQEITERIYGACGKSVIMQHGLASMRLEEKLDLWKLLEPDMSSINFNSHDEYFQPDADVAPNPCYSVHPIPELREYASLAKKNGVKLEIECFGTGAFWAIDYIRRGDFWTEDGERQQEPDLLADPLWCTFFIAWPGQGWQPPSARALFHMADHRPDRVNWNTSCMDPDPAKYWGVIAQAIIMGGHVRVGMEDGPRLTNGEWAKSNGDLVEKTVRIAKEVGREIASPEEAREIIGLPQR